MNNHSLKQSIDEFVQQFTDVIDDETATVNGRLGQSQIRALLESLLCKLNLVTREEFDAQTAVLARTRKKLQDLEELLADLETKVN